VANLRDSDRGQIILVAAFALAVIFVAMALIVNSAIFTENLASRGETAGSNGALDARAMIESSVGNSLEAANRYNTSDPVSAVQDSIENISVQSGRQAARSGRLVDVAYRSGEETNGRRIFQQEPSSTLANSGGDIDYIVAENVSRVPGGNGTRAFRLSATSIDFSTPFQVRAINNASDSNETWRMRVTEDSGVVRIETRRNDTATPITEACEVTSSGPYEIDVTGGTVNGEPCDALGTTESGENMHFSAGATDSYNIRFENADRISGNFSMVVHGSDLDLSAISGNTYPEDTSALYDVTVGYRYATSDLRYDTEIRVAPGEPDA